MNLVDLVLKLQELEKEAINVPEVDIISYWSDGSAVLDTIYDVRLGPDKDIVLIEVD